jgi:hypothetical protein
MAAYGTGDQVTATVPTGGTSGWGTWEFPNFVGELFKLSPLDTPLLTLIGGLTGGKSLTSPQWTWQDTLHRAPAVQSIVEGDDAVFTGQKRNERTNVVAIHQYGVEITYTKQAATGLLGTGGATPATGAVDGLGVQPVGDEMAWQIQIKVEQAALDVEKMILEGTYAYPADGTARQTQGIVGAISADTSTNWTATSGQEVDATSIDDISAKMYDEGAPKKNAIIMLDSIGKIQMGNNYSVSSNWNIQQRSNSMFGVNVSNVETAFGNYNVVVNRHLAANQFLILDLAYLAPCFLPIPGKGHFFIEPLAKAGAYDRAQLYGEIGLEYGPSKFHGRAYTLNQP